MTKARDPVPGVRKVATDRLSKTAGRVAHTVFGLGRDLLHPFRRGHSLPPPGTAPGLESFLEAGRESVSVQVTLIDYGPGGHQTHQAESLEAAFSEPRPEGMPIRWIDVLGLDARSIETFCRLTGVHSLSAEDILVLGQRPKLEAFDTHLLVQLRQIRIQEATLRHEQISLFCFDDLLVTFQEEAGDVFDPVRKRIANPASRFRKRKAEYLLYALIDSIVDHIFPLLERYGVALEDLEGEIAGQAPPQAQRRLFSMKRDLALLRRSMWPVREVLDGLYRDETGRISKSLKPYLRDVQDHVMQVIDLLESYRETASSLSDLYQTAVANRMNEVMKVLTLMASFFIPVTFIAGVYGMNFQHMPELDWPYAYPVFWGICLLVALGMGAWFWRRGWFGSRS